MSVLLFLGWLMVVVGVHGVYLHSTLYNNEVFTKRVTSVLEQPGVQAAIATKLTNVVIEKVPDAIIARPIIESAVTAVVEQPVFQELVVAALSKFHAIVLNPKTTQIVLTIEGAPQLIQKTIEPFDAKLAAQIGNAASAELARVPDPGPTLQLIQLGADVGPASWVVVAVGLLLLLLAAVIAPDRRRGAIISLSTLSLAGLGIVVVLSLANVGLGLAAAGDPVLSEAVAGVFEGIFADLRHIGYVIAAVGLIAAVLLWSLRYTLPVAASAGGRALGGATEAGHVALDTAGSALGAAATAATGASTEATSLRPGDLHAQDLTIVLISGIRRLFVPAASRKGLILQGVVALAIAAAVLLAWSTVVDVIVLVIALALIALALNRLLLVLVSRRAPSGAAAIEAAGATDGS